jgi:uncharacterized protein YfdQ (DUF2303 family)
MADPQTTPPIALPTDALNAAIEGARIASPTIQGPDGATHAFVPRGFALQKLSDETDLPPWVQQRVTIDDRASLSAYANRFKDDRSIIIANYDAGTISARLDWHQTEGAHYEMHSPNAHSVTLKLCFSEEFTRWNGMAGKLHNQEEFARFLEENSVDVAYPEAAQMVEISRDFEATVGQTYKSSVRLDNGDRRLRFESESRAMNEVVVPQRFTLSIPIYNGEAPDTLTALFRWRAQPSGGVLLGFDWHRLEFQRRAHFQQIAFTAAEETGLPVYIGREG